MSTITLSVWDLSIASVLVLILAGLSIWSQLGLGKKILWAALRTAVQLTLVGFVLEILFSHVSFFSVLTMSMLMLLIAGWEIWSRQERPLRGFRGYSIGLTAMFLSSFTTAVFSLLVIFQPEPWYTPQYSIPLLGMLLGNTMTGISLAMDRMTESAWVNRSIIEQRLLLGQSFQEASAAYCRKSYYVGLIPIINSMAAAGIVHLPGMMTGQILAGNSPFEAAKYQIMIMFLITAGMGFGTMIAIRLTSAYLFDERDRLRLDRIQNNQNHE
ncbi:MAG: putative ABC transport system permease protein [Chlamydiales bacterium]|jgi:putative ABC transport system permease protein